MKGGELLQKRQSKAATMSAMLRGWHELVTEPAQELQVPKADLLLQSRHWEATLDKMDAQTVNRSKE